MRRWAARPTFYYEVGGLAGACGGFYIYNLEVVPVSSDHQMQWTPGLDINKLLHRFLVVDASTSSLQAQSSSLARSCTNKSSKNTKVVFCLRRTLNTNSSNAS
jgi:hypothetical protein